MKHTFAIFRLFLTIDSVGKMRDATAGFIPNIAGQDIGRVGVVAIIWITEVRP